MQLYGCTSFEFTRNVLASIVRRIIIVDRFAFQSSFLCINGHDCSEFPK